MSPKARLYHHQRPNSYVKPQVAEPEPRNVAPLTESGVNQSRPSRSSYQSHTLSSNNDRTPPHEREDGQRSRKTSEKENSRGASSRPREPTALDVAARGPAIGASGPIHDQIIRTYRREIANYATLNHDFEVLKKRLADVQQRKIAFEDSIDGLKRDYENQLDQQERVVQVLEQDLDELKQSNFESNQESTDLARIISDARSEVSSKDLQLTQLQQDIHRARDQQDANKSDIHLFQ